MGNTLIKNNSDARFNDSSVAQTVRELVMSREDVLLGTNVKVNIAKACASDVIKKGITDTPSLSSIPLPMIDDAEDAVKSGRRLPSQLVGLQIDDNRDGYCGNDAGATVGSAGVNVSLNRGGGARSKADLFMLNYCAKSLYDRGCIKIGKKTVKDPITGKMITIDIPQLATAKENPMCYTKRGKLDYGPPECYCLNSISGPSMNTWPSDSNKLDPMFKAGNPYGLSGEYTSDSTESGGNNFTKFSLNIFRQKANEQYPKQLDEKCTSALIGSKENGRAAAYKLKEYDDSVQVCMNQINIVDSNIGNLDISDVKQSCGNATKEVAVEGLNVAKENKVDPLQQLAEQKRIQDLAAAEARADIERKQREAENKKLQDQMAAMQKMMADLQKQKDADAAKAAADKVAAEAKAKKDSEDAAAAAAAKAKAEAEAKARKDAEDKVAADAKAKKVFDEAVAAATKSKETVAPATTMPARTTPATTMPARTAPATTMPATTMPATTMPASTTAPAGVDPKVVAAVAVVVLGVGIGAYMALKN